MLQFFAVNPPAIFKFCVVPFCIDRLEKGVEVMVHPCMTCMSFFTDAVLPETVSSTVKVPLSSPLINPLKVRALVLLFPVGVTE